MKYVEEDKMFIPLEKYVPKLYKGIDCQNTMYMGNSGYNNEIYLYKHVDTRHYINVDEEGNFYLYVPSDNDTKRYTIIDKTLALKLLIS